MIMREIAADVAAKLAARGIDPNRDVPDVPAFDLVEFRHQQANNWLDRSVPADLRHAVADHPTVRDWIDRFLADPTATPSLLLKGRPGTGKSHQAFGAVRELALAYADRGDRLDWRGVTHVDFNEARRPGYHDPRDVLDEYANTTLLILDDLGTGLGTEYSETGLFGLIHRRLRKPTIYTTNLTAAEREEILGGRVTSRINTCIQVTLTGPDRRREATL